MHELGHVALHALTDTLRLLPFLFLSYLLMEFLEHRAGEATERMLRRAGRVGPLVGGALGMLPQCGFSAAAAGLYTGRVITQGTLIAVFLATSDEMLPILISSGADPLLIVRLLLSKLVIGVSAGFLIDGVAFLLRRRGWIREASDDAIEELCERERCDCGNRFWLSALKHTAYITVFIYVIFFLLDALTEFVGTAWINALLVDRPMLGSLLAAVVGLLPGCAPSIALTTLYLEGAISVGAMLSGLLVNAGVGIAILLRNNRPVRDSFRILLVLFAVSVLSGILIDLTPLGAWIG